MAAAFEAEGFRAEADRGTFEPCIPPIAHAAPVPFKPIELPQRAFRVLPLPATAVELFEAFFTADLITKWLSYTEAAHPFAKSITMAEVYTFLASLIYMGIHRENSFRDYWSTQQDEDPPHLVRQHIGRDRFFEIYRHLILWDPDEAEGEFRVYHRVHEVSDAIRLSSLRFVEIPTEITVDEAMVRFTGRSREATIIKTKPTPRGFKIWVIATNGYFLGWIFHVNNVGPLGIPYPKNQPSRRLPHNASPAEIALKALNDTQKAVVQLVRQLPHQPYHLFMDNLFNTPKFLVFLRNYQGCGATGTARLNNGVLKTFADLKREDASRDNIPWNKLQSATLEHGLVNHFAWKDNALALFFTTVYTGVEAEVVRPHNRPKTKQAAWFWGSKSRMDCPLPAFADQYNLQKGGVDTGDQLRAHNVLTHRVRRSRHTVIFIQFLLEQVLVNTFILQRDFDGNLPWEKAVDQGRWRRQLYKELWAKYGRDNQPEPPTAPIPTPTPTAAPTAHQFIFRNKKSNCKACMGKSLNGGNGNGLREVPINVVQRRLRRTTRYGCSECDIALCNSKHCWYLWHQQN